MMDVGKRSIDGSLREKNKLFAVENKIKNKKKYIASSKIKNIIKRDGTRAVFDKNKIKLALSKAFKACGSTRSEFICAKITNEIIKILCDKKIFNPDVEKIQDLVEESLMKFGYTRVAKAYIIYREERNKSREKNSKLMKTYHELIFEDSRDADVKRENANINGDTAMGAMLKFGSEGAKEFYASWMLSPEFRNAHESGDIHIHDLDFYALTTTCCQIDLEKLFKNGFSTGHGTLREPNSITSYSALTCIAIQSNQNDQHGGQSVPNFDRALSHGVTKSFVRFYKANLIKFLSLDLQDINLLEITKIQNKILSKNINLKLEDNKIYLEQENKLINKLYKNLDSKIIKKYQECALSYALQETEREVFQSMEALVHNLNTMHSRAGAQTPFSSINYGTDVSPEGRMITKNILLALEAGLGHNETPIFPIHIFRVKDGINFNPGDKNYDLFKLACRVSSKRLFPNFAFQDAPFNLKYYQENKPETEIAYMGCRTRVIANCFDKTREISYGRGNLSFTSINLPRIALRAHKDLDKFFRSLDKLIDLCSRQLLERLEIISKRKVKNFPFLMGEGIWLDSEKLNQEDFINNILKHGTLTIGFIGLAECLVALTGKHHGEDINSQELGLKIIRHMRERIDKLCEKYKLNFSLIATPAEGLAGRFVKLDVKKFGKKIGITDREYYTNSFHVPVYYKISVCEKIKLEAPYHELTNGGHITYVELDGDPSKNLDAFEKIIRFMKENNIGYGSINHPIDRDPVCGYAGIINNICPGCGRTEQDFPFERIRRITGYLVGSLERFNNAKLAEVKDRVKHNKK